MLISMFWRVYLCKGIYGGDFSLKGEILYMQTTISYQASDGKWYELECFDYSIPVTYDEQRAADRKNILRGALALGGMGICRTCKGLSYCLQNRPELSASVMSKKLPRSMDAIAKMEAREVCPHWESMCIFDVLEDDFHA